MIDIKPKLTIDLPNDPKHIWLALGDETGSWDFETNSSKNSKRGLVLILGRLDVWWRALDEDIAGQTVAQRMDQPLQHLPPEHKGKDSFHHVLNAFTLGVDNMSPELRGELRQNLAWLAQHPRLLTFGCNASHVVLYQDLTHSQDASTALAKAYAALIAYVMPFLARQDVLLLGFESRSENAGGIATTRSGFDESLNLKNQERADMDMRGFLSALRDKLIGDLNQVWPDGDWDRRFDLAVLYHLRNHPRLNLHHAPLNAWKGLADLGPSLLRVRQDSAWSDCLGLANTMPNVHFLELSELLK